MHKFASKTKQGQWHRQFKNCSQGDDSVAEYTVTFRNLWNRCDPRHKIPLPSIIADYTTGLRDDIAIFMHASNPETLEQAEETAKNIEASMEARIAKGSNTKLEKKIRQLEKRLEEVSIQPSNPLQPDKW